jgi:hypothetical protein
MSKINNTKLQIIKTSAKLFTEEGYSNVSIAKIGKILGISKGNITFHFHSKEEILAVLIKELCDFQWLLMEKEAKEEMNSLLAYCLELTTLITICEEVEAIRDFYVSAYITPLTLDIIRKNDTKKTQEVFKEYCPNWTIENWIATENIVSGIECASFMTREIDTPLNIKIEKALNSVMLLYDVPEELRRQKIKKVLELDYRTLSKRILKEFKEYLEEKL